MITRFILASSSPRRRELLAELGIPFDILKPEIDETQQPQEAPLDYVQRLSREKALRVAAQVLRDAVILAADTVVILGADTLGVGAAGEILGKPQDATVARQMLQALRGRTHQVYTALTLLACQTGQVLFQETTVTRTAVIMRDYTDAEIEAYIATGDPFDKAGSYAILHPVFRPVAQIDGSYSNVVGLPLETFRKMKERIDKFIE